MGVPERQPERWPRERSVEHTELPPVFGTTCPPRALSGALRKLAYARYSEGRAAHWLLLIAGDRVDVVESAARSFVTLRPDNPVTRRGSVPSSPTTVCARDAAGDASTSVTSGWTPSSSGRRGWRAPWPSSRWPGG